MRILFCTNSLGARGGIEMVTIVKANSFADIPGCEVAVCYTDRGTYPHDVIHPLSDKVRVYDLGVPFWDLYPLNAKNLLVNAPKKFLKLRRVLKRVIRDFRPDIVITTGSYEKFGVASIRPSRLLGKTCAKVREYHFCSNYRDYLPHKPPVAWLAAAFEYRVLGRMFDMNYLLTREDMETNFKGRKGFDYMYNPVTFSAPERRPIPERDNAVIVVCRLTAQKNVHAIICAWAAISGDVPSWRLRIVGDGDQRKELESLADKLGVMDTVEFLGFRKDIPELLSHSKILVMTSRYEGFTLNMLEAIVCGTVPVAYRAPYGPADLITDGVDGVLVDYMDEAQFAIRLKALIQSPERLEAMSEAAVERSRDFLPGNIAIQWMEKYGGLLQKIRNRSGSWSPIF